MHALDCDPGRQSMQQWPRFQPGVIRGRDLVQRHPNRKSASLYISVGLRIQSHWGRALQLSDALKSPSSHQAGDLPFLLAVRTMPGLREHAVPPWSVALFLASFLVADFKEKLFHPVQAWEPVVQ